MGDRIEKKTGEQRMTGETRMTRRDFIGLACSGGLAGGLAARSGGGLASGRAEGLAGGLGGEAGSRRKKRQTKKAARPAPPPPGPISGDSLYRDLITYYNLGEHRTASTGDQKTSDWLNSELKKAGMRTAFQTFGLRQFFPSKSALVLDGNPVACFPLWPPTPTGASPIVAPLVDYHPSERLSGAVALIRFPFDGRAAILKGSAQSELILDAARLGARAVIAITEGPSGEIIALNVLEDTRPWPVPVLLAPPRSEPLLRAAATRRATVSVLIDGREDLQATARNVIGRLGRGNKSIVVSTPQSGWFRCAGERGPGIALWLGLARWVRKNPSNFSYVFVSTSGHELGGLGIRAFLDSEAPRPGSVAAWVHLGAGIATWKWQQTDKGMVRTREVDANRLLMCSPGLVPVLAPIFADLAGLKPGSSQAVGEYRDITKAGYRTMAIAAAHMFHHTPADSPEVTSPELLEPVATALVNTLGALEDQSR